MKRLQILAFAIPLAAIVLWTMRFTSPTLRIEGYKARCYSLMSDGESTQYAKGYSHVKYLQIDPGMRFDEVYAILGMPFNQFTYRPNQLDEQQVITYSKRGGQGDFHTRQIRFRDGKVIQVFGGYYLSN